MNILLLQFCSSNLFIVVKFFDVYGMLCVKLFDEIEVLEKVMNLFWEKGYYVIFIQDLVNYLGINWVSFYDIYGGKKELFEQVFVYYWGRNICLVRVFMDWEQDVKMGF